MKRRKAKTKRRSKGKMPKVGDKAPDFRLQDAGGKEVTLAGLLGKSVVLYFFPKALTSG
jgi:peroxiredoxin Q/BCP